MTTIAIHGFTLDLPDDHWLQQIRQQLPDYSENIGRLAAVVELKYPGRGFIDIGANVGNTAAIVCTHSKLPILCVEASESYYGLLKENVRRLGADVELEGALLDSAPSERLDSILARHPRFQSSKILKIDTAGMDGLVLEGALDWIASARPVLFWGHDIARDAAANGPLFAAGYSNALVFDNRGEFVQTISLDAWQKLAELAGYLAGGEGFCGSYDICAFHNDDSDLYSQLRQIELENRRLRRRPSPRPLDEAQVRALLQAQFERYGAQLTSAVEEAVKRSTAAQTAELPGILAYTQLERNRLQLQIAELETRIVQKDAEIDRLHAIVRDFLRVEDLKAQLASLRHELETSLALRFARSLHWILGPIRRRIGPPSDGGRP